MQPGNRSIWPDSHVNVLVYLPPPALAALKHAIAAPAAATSGSGGLTVNLRLDISGLLLQQAPARLGEFATAADAAGAEIAVQKSLFRQQIAARQLAVGKPDTSSATATGAAVPDAAVPNAAASLPRISAQLIKPVTLAASAHTAAPLHAASTVQSKTAGATRTTATRIVMPAMKRTAAGRRSMRARWAASLLQQQQQQQQQHQGTSSASQQATFLRPARPIAQDSCRSRAGTRSSNSSSRAICLLPEPFGPAEPNAAVAAAVQRHNSRLLVVQQLQSWQCGCHNLCSSRHQHGQQQGRLELLCALLQ
uniref:Uncharacterized protein n=1 Tax=Tetradesmus obliquus TaxID=3088 RepID=A0A383VZD9_TETOB|eukprot:jgi/Sobl393_1/6299/SZX70807.1